MVEVSEAVGEVGENVKPVFDRIKEAYGIADKVRRVQEEIEAPPPTVEALPSPDLQLPPPEDELAKLSNEGRDDWLQAGSVLTGTAGTVALPRLTNIPLLDAPTTPVYMPLVGRHPPRFIRNAVFGHSRRWGPIPAKGEAT